MARVTRGTLVKQTTLWDSAVWIYRNRVGRYTPVVRHDDGSVHVLEMKETLRSALREARDSASEAYHGGGRGREYEEPLRHRVGQGLRVKRWRHGNLGLHTYRDAVAKHLERTYDMPVTRANALAESEPGYIAYARRRHISPGVAASAIAAKHHRQGSMKLGLRKRHGNSTRAATSYYKGHEVQAVMTRGAYHPVVDGAQLSAHYDTIREAIARGKKHVDEGSSANYHRPRRNKRTGRFTRAR